MPQKEWINEDDRTFYQVIPEALLKKLYAASGMLNCINGRMSISFFALTNGADGSVLEVGAGMGRVISELKKQGYSEANITAVERDAKFVEKLQQHFPGLKIYTGSIQDFDTNQKFDHIGCWYSVFLEFNVQEQLELLKKLAQLSKPTTTMIIDIVYPGSESNATHAEGKNVTIELAGVPTFHGYVLTLNELRDHAKTVGLEVAFVPYWTETGRKRVQCILVSNDSLYLAQVKQLAKIKTDFFETQHHYKQNRRKGQSSENVAKTLTTF